MFKIYKHNIDQIIKNFQPGIKKIKRKTKFYICKSITFYKNLFDK